MELPQWQLTAWHCIPAAYTVDLAPQLQRLAAVLDGHVYLLPRGKVQP